MVWDLGERKVIVESDSLLAVNTINSQQETSNSTWTLIQTIRNLLQRDWEVRIVHIYWEANVVAVRLENVAKGLQRGWHMFDTSPIELKDLLQNDIIGAYCNWLICNHSIPSL